MYLNDTNGILFFKKFFSFVNILTFKFRKCTLNKQKKSSSSVLIYFDYSPEEDFYFLLVLKHEKGNCYECIMVSNGTCLY